MSVDLNISKNVRTILLARGITQRELAGMTDMPEGIVSKLIRGDQRWKATDVHDVATVLGVDPGQLFVEPHPWGWVR